MFLFMKRLVQRFELGLHRLIHLDVEDSRMREETVRFEARLVDREDSQHERTDDESGNNGWRSPGHDLNSESDKSSETPLCPVIE